ncbi:EscU/YscU/HrcU family type III secretion system export apparatus switch protein [Phenylobacterium sp. J367]|uniref:EscU/YscU/HrcU family type III secretion system export apparatus switch protein n=1 Tax=Phenylobacterium sp. J367 TaxID=2898435 RepID=UPI0027E27BF9|nr:EscU/YscU/HrcU family type III secretion system export apparatus switch protein [Phenylobacterium sp. J367]
MRALAEESGVPVIEDPPLARALYAAVEVEGDDPAGPLRGGGEDHRLHPERQEEARAAGAAALRPLVQGAPVTMRAL